MFQKELRNLNLSCKAMRALRETGFSLIRARLLESECKRWEASTVCSDNGAKQFLERATVVLELSISRGEYLL